MISIAVIALLFVLIIVFCVISAKSWHWANIVFLILAYIAGVAACVGLAEVLDGRTKALAAVKDSEMRLNGLGIDSDSDGIDDAIDVEVVGGGDANGDGISDSKSQFALANQANYAIYGPPESVRYGKDSLRGLNEALLIQLHGKGRVWSGSVTASGDNRIFTFPQARPVGENDNASLNNVVLYAFLDQTVGDTSYPTTFIGKVRVVNETPQAWELTPQFLVKPGIFDSVGQGVTWSLYEKMPADRHDTFVNIENVDIEDESFDLTAFRTALEEKYLPANLLGFDINSADDEVARQAAIDYERFIDRIAFDGLSFGRIEQWIATAPNRVSGDFSADPEEIFVKYQFLKKSSSASPFLVDAVGKVANEGTFTKNGLAVDMSIHNGEEVTFEVDDIVLVDSNNAEGYTRGDGNTVKPFNTRFDGIEVKELDRVFYRKLNNFPLMLEEIELHIKELDERTVVIKSDIAIAEKTLADSNTQQEKRDSIIAGLREDNSNLKQDLEVIDELLENRQGELQALRDRIVELEETIKRRQGQIQ